MITRCGDVRRWSWCLVVGAAVAACGGGMARAGEAGSGSTVAIAGSSAWPALDARIDAGLPDWRGFYEISHRNPELSGQEKESAARMAAVFRDAGIDVTQNVGGYGVVGVLKNGDGPVLLIRGDMDALPIIEETGLPYASAKKVTMPDGRAVGVMHACGHDMHQTVLAGTAQVLAGLKDRWKGTVVFVAQPAEEIGKGSRLMIEDGIFERFPNPTRCIALHVNHEMASGTVGITPEWVWANVDSVDITIFGKGGHGAFPHSAVDPIVTGAQVVTALQTIVSRNTNPVESAVVTVGSFHAGTKHNIIPETASLQLTVRSFTDESRAHTLDAIRRVTVNTCKAMGCPKEPDVKLIEDEFTPAAYNDPQLSAHAAEVFRRLLGEENVIQRPASMGGEDFGRFAKQAGVPGFMFLLGVVEPARLAASKRQGGEPLPTVHSSRFRTDENATIRTGVRCMSALALSLLGEG